MVLLDATYKTILLILPLFFISVKTNVDYQVVRSFKVERETADCTKEALHILKEENKDWKRSFFMTDYDESEIKAIESEFEDVRVLLCDLHREQSWERWLKRKENDVENVDEVLTSLLHLAKSSDADQFYEHLTDLQAYSSWDNPKWKKNIEKVWLPVKEKWPWAFRNDARITASTNNGPKCQQRILKQTYLNKKTKYSVTPA